MCGHVNTFGGYVDRNTGREESIITEAIIENNELIVTIKSTSGRTISRKTTEINGLMHLQKIKEMIDNVDYLSNNEKKTIETYMSMMKEVTERFDYKTSTSIIINTYNKLPDDVKSIILGVVGSAIYDEVKIIAEKIIEFLTRQ